MTPMIDNYGKRCSIVSDPGADVECLKLAESGPSADPLWLGMTVC
jgi:hypothetical protein